MTVSEKLKELELHGHMMYMSGIDTEIHDEIIALVQAAEQVDPESKALNDALEAIAGKLSDRP